jgi:hypothetical protein
LISQPTGIPSGNFNHAPYQNPFGTIQSQFTGFHPNANQPLFNAALSAPPVPPTPPASNINNTSPANIFAQMKSGTFAADNNDSRVQPAEKYDALRPNPIVTQATGWGQPFQGGYMGYQR